MALGSTAEDNADSAGTVDGTTLMLGAADVSWTLSLALTGANTDAEAALALASAEDDARMLLTEAELGAALSLDTAVEGVELGPEAAIDELARLSVETASTEDKVEVTAETLDAASGRAEILSK
ncbi:hypothetical protein PUNSTDRAFT_130150 [Punctularia strigosozonata HHB-11173 SS5]|uniref:uncharacterized protein n=1 Tax=Punctularia strigosozonata (strain HHB-11173) TaxID=741275 RepID=UPI0004416ACD|nr:uncharacterized protein PUNSTDRAFT_130150 [Punctularia strigosozonata HHB-11173 SS5]EIN14523.1 hypothetical protein PUNSTDRAFT_130150 [Punctularia strigosozonata HHB-11173 SS5]